MTKENLEVNSFFNLLYSLFSFDQKNFLAAPFVSSSFNLSPICLNSTISSNKIFFLSLIDSSVIILGLDLNETKKSSGTEASPIPPNKAKMIQDKKVKTAIE